MQMELQTPDYYEKFRCLASDCPHSCCIGWEVVIDEETVAYYAAVPGPMGEKLRRCLTEQDGETCFRLTEDRRCPFLDGENLCEIHRKLGEKHTSSVCRSHPRFVTDYGPLREVSLSAACPAVRDLLLGTDAPLHFPTAELAESGTSDPETEPYLTPLRQCRDLGLDILRSRTVPLNRRLIWLLRFADQAQSLLDFGETGALPSLCREYCREPELLEPPDPAAAGHLTADALRLLTTLEILEPDWPGLVYAAGKFPEADVPDTALDRVACYFLFRYFLSSVFDGDVLTPVEMTVFSVLAVRRLSGGPGISEALRRYCREIEHCPENLKSLRRAFCHDKRFNTASFLKALQND